MPRMSASVLRERRKKREAARKAAAASKRGRGHYVTRRREELTRRREELAAKKAAAKRPAAKKAVAKKPAAKKVAAKKVAAKKPAAKKVAARRSPDKVLAASRRNSAERRETARKSRAVIDAGVNAPPPVGSAPVDRVKTKGGEYKVYKKKSEEAKSFRRAFLDAKTEKLKKFKWRDRWYSTKEK